MAEGYMKRYALLRLAERLIDITAARIRCRAAPVEEIIRFAAEDKQLSQLAVITETLNKLGSEKPDFREQWSSALNETRPSYMRDEEYNILAEYGRSLGATDIQGQLICLDNLKGLLSPLIKEAYAEKNEKSKLCRSMGMLIGLMLAVILI